MRSDGREIIAKVEGGKLGKFVSETVRGWLESYGEGVIRITLEPYTPGRSNSQNRYYWKVLVGGIKSHMSDTGAPVSRDAIHHYIKYKLCPDLCEVEEEHDIFGEKYVMRENTTTKITTENFNLLCERVRAWAAENGLQLPLPNEHAF